VHGCADIGGALLGRQELVDLQEDVRKEGY
jgi:hypothetical protein